MRTTWLALCAALMLGAAMLLGCGDLQPCETDLNCVILCQCDNGGDGFSSGYRCRAGYCRDGHRKDQDCERICGNVVPPFGDDDDAGDDDSGASR